MTVVESPKGRASHNLGNRGAIPPFPPPGYCYIFFQNLSRKESSSPPAPSRFRLILRLEKTVVVVQCSKRRFASRRGRPAPALRIHLHHVVESSGKDDLRLLLHVGGGVVNYKISALDHIHHVAIGNRLHPGHHASWRQRRVGGVVGDINHR